MWKRERGKEQFGTNQSQLERRNETKQTTHHSRTDPTTNERNKVPSRNIDRNGNIVASKGGRRVVALASSSHLANLAPFFKFNSIPVQLFHLQITFNSIQFDSPHRPRESLPARTRSYTNPTLVELSFITVSSRVIPLPLPPFSFPFPSHGSSRSNSSRE